MRNARRLLAALLAVVMLIPSILVPGYAAETTGFKDVREDSWYADAVDYVSAAGYMKGTSKDAFSPGEDVTRAMFVTILSRVARAQTDNTASAFGDVAANQYYSGAIDWAAEKGIVNGVGGGLFAPYRSITRQDLAAMLYRFVNAMGYELSEGESRTYTDEAAISAYAADAVRFVTSTGLFAGYQDGSFRPKATATRAQTAVIVMRLAQLLDGQIVDPEPMPAQSFDQTSEQMQVSVNAPEGALPENTKMTVSRVTDEAALAELASKVDAKVLGAADISFAKDGAELEPARKVSVRISLDALQNAKNPAVVHVKDDGSFEYVSSSVVTTRGKADAIEFEADSFSVYAVIDILGGYTLTVTFYARLEGSVGAWNVVNKQIIRADQLGKGLNPIKDPGVPGITASQAFEGWIESSAAFNPDFAYGVDATTKTIKQINDDYDVTLSANKEIVYYAAVYEVVYVTYHDQAGAVTSTEYKKIPANQTTVAVTITEDYPPMKSNQNFSGWVKEEDVARPGGVDGTLPTYKEGAASRKWAVGSTQNLSENVDLYPYVEEGYWLSFNNNIAKNSEKLGFEDNTSAEYISPKFVPNGTTPTQPSFPSNDPRHGYTFVGWYEDADMTTAFNFNQQLTEDTTVYAKWAFGTSSYTVVFWKQKPTDSVDAVDSVPDPNPDELVAKTYDYDSYRIVSNATTGSSATLSTADKRKGNYSGTSSGSYGFYFTLNENKTQDGLAVKGDGSTVLNVYYDRKTITYNFKADLISGYSSTNSGYYSSYFYHYGYDSTNGVYRIYTNASTYSSGDYRSPNWYTNAACTSSYSGTVYHAPFNTVYTTSDYPPYDSAAGTVTIGSISGLYESVIDCYDWDGYAVSGSQWPDSGIHNVWVNALDTRYVNKMFQFTPGTYTTTTSFDYYLAQYETSSTTRPVTCLGMDTSGNYTINLDTYDLKSTETLYFAGDEYYGYDCDKYNRTSNSYSSATTFTGSEFSISYDNIGSSGHAYVWYKRQSFPLNFFSGTTALTDYNTTVYYDKSLSTYKPATDPTAPEGTYFDGWYADPTLKTPFDFNQKMPHGGVSVYAKFSPKWYRIVVDYKRGNSSSVITVPGSTQKASFTVQYGSTIQTSSLMQAQRLDLDGNDNWMLVGLYLDEACTQPFNQNMQVPFGLTEEQEVYPAGSRTGIDDITGETWSDEAYPDIRAKITLYAKWRVNPEGVVGIKVRYLGDHAENDKGYFDSNEKPHSMTLQNPVYTDGAKASAHSATVPSLPDEDTPDVGRRFLYWEILDKNGNPTGEIVYPGSPFTIDINKAVEIKTPLPDPNCTHTNEGTSTIVSVAAVAATCTGTGVAAHYKCTKCGCLFTDAAGTNETTLDALTVAATQPNLSSDKADSSAHLTNLSANANPNPVTAATDKYEKVTSFENGKKYLISNNSYFLGNTHYNSYTYGISTVSAAPTQGSDGNYTFSTDMTPYLVEASENNGTWAFKALGTSFSGDAYVGVANKTYGTGYCAVFGTTPFYWTLSGNYLRCTLSSSYYYLYRASGYFDVTTSTSSSCSLSFYKLVEDTDYTISYNANASDATGTMADQTLTAGSGTLTANAFTRSGYTFAGWNTAADGTGAAASDRANVKVNANLTLYAQWVKTPGSGDTVTYERATSLTAGEDYVVVIDNYAVGNTTVTGSHYLNAQSVTVNSNNTITVPANAASSVLWHATGTTSGWSFYNPSANGFIGLSSDYYLSIESNVGRAWTYDGTDLNNNCQDEGNEAYYYLSYDTTNACFTTSTSTGRNVKFYKRVITAAAATYSVTVDSGITNGTVSASPTTAAAGATITLAVSPNTGYEIGTVTYTPAGDSAVTISPVYGVYSFQMPAANVTVNATFTASSTPEPGITTIERWVPVNNVEDGEDYLIGFVYDGNTYLGLNYSPNTTNHYYYSYKFATDGIQSSKNTFLGYTGTPIFDGVNITGVEGNATNLEHATWTFNATTGGYYVVSKNNSNRYLYAKKGGSSSSYSNSLYWDQYPNTTANVWTWDATNHHLYNTTNSVYAGVFTLSNSVYMTCEATNDSNYTNYIYVQLYKKEIINVYNVTLNPTENGTVRANKSTATAGETVTLILTPSEGYQVASVTVTDSNGATVPVTGTSGIITFTMPASNVTVSATFTNVIPDNVWVVSFVDEDGKDIPGMNDIYVPKNTADNLAESALPDPAKEEHYFLGWYQGNVKCTFPMTVNSDIVLTPKYSPMYAYDYTLTLRAVYGPYNPDATTHIYWYANNGTDAHNGAGERYTSEYTVTESGTTTTTTKLPINAQVDIPRPTGSGSQLVFAGDNGGALTWEDHVFLGWARVDNGGSADYAEAQILTPDDIYLKWTGTEYEVRNDDGTYSPFSSQKVYADETTPYHDMYAVWAGFYYIYHSSDGTLEAVQVPYDVRDTKDLVAEVKTNYLYGGYYKTSGAVVSVDATEMRAAKDSILNQQNFWNYADATVSGSANTSTSLTDDEGAVVYNGTSVKHTVEGTTVMFWEKAQAYTELGTELAPTAGTVYYLKEVPKTFLPNRLVYVKADKNTQLYDGRPIEEGKITSLYLLTAVDDRNYAENGFFVGRSRQGQVVTGEENGYIKTADTVSRVFTIFVKNGKTYSYNANDLSPSIGGPQGVDKNLVGFVAAKHLDYNWITAHVGTDPDTPTFYLKPYWTTLDGVTVEQDNIEGVSITSDGKDIQYVRIP